jgi:hypothetical protein
MRKVMDEKEMTARYHNKESAEKYLRSIVKSLGKAMRGPDPLVGIFVVGLTTTNKKVMEYAACEADQSSLLGCVDVLKLRMAYGTLDFYEQQRFNIFAKANKKAKK